MTSSPGWRVEVTWRHVAQQQSRKDRIWQWAVIKHCYFHILFIVHLNSTECDYGERNCLFGLYCPANDGYACMLNSKQQQIQNHWTIKSAPTRIFTGGMKIFFADPGNKWHAGISFFQDEWSLVRCLFSIFKFPDLLCLWKLIHAARLNHLNISSRVLYCKAHIQYTRVHRCFQPYHCVISLFLSLHSLSWTRSVIISSEQ